MTVQMLLWINPILLFWLGNYSLFANALMLISVEDFELNKFIISFFSAVISYSLGAWLVTANPKTSLREKKHQCYNGQTYGFYIVSFYLYIVSLYFSSILQSKIPSFVVSVPCIFLLWKGWQAHKYEMRWLKVREKIKNSTK